MATDLDKYYTIGPDADDAMKLLRPSTAYDQDATEYAANEYISRDFILATKPTLASDDSSPPHATTFSNVCESTNYLYGKYNTQIYRKLKSGGNWTAITGMAGIGFGWSDGGDRVCFLANDGDGYWTTTEGGATSASWNTVTTPLQITPGAGGVFAIGRGCGKYNGDTICLSEYDVSGAGDADNSDGKRIWRSADAGDTWATVQDCPDPGHFHCVGYHAATGYWFGFRGDGSNREVWKSVDGGENWTEVVSPNGIAEGQPVDILDVGDSRYLLLGSDSYYGICKYDCIDDKFVSSSASSILHRASNERIFYNLYYYEGIVYGFAETGTAVGDWPNSIPDELRRTTVFISTDKGDTFNPWFSINTPGAGNGLRYISGVADGKLYCNLKTGGVQSNKMLTIPTEANKRTFILTQDKEDNQLENDNRSHFITDASTWTIGADADETYNASGGLIGDKKSVEISKDVLSSDTFSTNDNQGGVANSNGKKWIARAYVKGSTGYQFVLNYMVHLYSSSARNGLYNFYKIDQDDYTEIIMQPDRMESINETNKAYDLVYALGTASAKYPAGNDYSLTFAGMTRSLYRGYFTEGTTDTAKTVYSRQFAVEDDWTIMETIIADLPSEFYVQYALFDSTKNYGQDVWIYYDSNADNETEAWFSSGGDPGVGALPGTDPAWVSAKSWKWHLYTLHNGENSWISVYMDSALSLVAGVAKDGYRFKADIYSDGVLSETITMAEPYAFRRFAQLDFGLSMNSSDDKLRFYVRTTDGIIEELVSTGTFAEFQNCILTETFAGRSSDNAAEGYMPQMCSWVLPQNNKQFDTAMSSSEIDTEMDNIDLEDSPLSTGSGISIYGTKQSIYK